MKVITLCGSARYELEFIQANKELSLRGMTVFSLSVLPRDAGKKDWYTHGQKTMLDLVHLDKILKSDSVVIVHPEYIGESTAREIMWAHTHQIPVIGVDARVHWESEDERWQSIATRAATGLNDQDLVRRAYLRLHEGEEFELT